MMEKLRQLGLSENEAKVYLASLELGQANVQEIAKKAGINRPTSYFVIENLMKKGLLSSFHKEKKQYFTAADPDRLFDILEKEKIAAEEKKEELTKILPELHSLFRKTGRPVVRYYEGKEGISAMVREFLEEATGTVRMVYSYDAITKIFSKEDREKWQATRLQKGTKTKVLYTRQEGMLQATPHSDRRKIPFEKFPVNCDIAIYNDKIRMASLGERLSGIIIEDKELSEAIKAIFEMAWGDTEKYKEQE